MFKSAFVAVAALCALSTISTAQAQTQVTCQMINGRAVNCHPIRPQAQRRPIFSAAIPGGPKIIVGGGYAGYGARPRPVVQERYAEERYEERRTTQEPIESTGSEDGRCFKGDTFDEDLGKCVQRLSKAEVAQIGPLTIQNDPKCVGQKPGYSYDEEISGANGRTTTLIHTCGRRR